jgi:serine/threonine protein kinase
MSEASEVRAGDVLDDRYRVTSLIGAGGMGRVYRADDLVLGRAVALKVVHAAAAGVPVDDRVRSETTLLASLSHPALVTLYDARLTGDGPRYLVMELLDGPTLADRIDGGPLSLDELNAVAENLAEGLHVVHAAGIVHRDIKPSNILLAPSPIPGLPMRAKLADFGIAHLLDSARITQPGLAVGTVGYLAPEQVRGAAPAPASDVYSLGLVLREAATATRAFAPALGTEQLFARLNADPDLPPTLTPRWRDLLVGMLARDPAARPTALDVLLALRSPTGAVVAPGASLAPADVRNAAPRGPRAVTTTGEPTAPLPPLSPAGQASAAPSAETLSTEPLRPGPPPPLPDVTASPSRQSLRSRRRPRRSRRAVSTLWLTAAAVVIVGSVVTWGAVGGLPTVASTPSPPDPTTTEIAEPAPRETTVDDEAKTTGERAVTVSDDAADPSPADPPADRTDHRANSRPGTGEKSDTPGKSKAKDMKDKNKGKGKEKQPGAGR